jgi:predicted pyridoxine 5'-phosphate oxidase superfamily flavin-nucleotide-binding protein
MPLLPQEVSLAWDKRKGPVIFSTVDQQGHPNAIYATCVGKYNDQTLVIANNYFSKTIQNIESGSTGSILFITERGEAYQVKGPIEYHTQGPVFDDMKQWNPEKHPGHGATALKVETVYKGAEKLL